MMVGHMDSWILPPSLSHMVLGHASVHLLMLFPLPENPFQFLLSG